MRQALLAASRPGCVAIGWLIASSAVADTGRTMIVLDGSGSMWGQIDGRAKIEIAREVVGDVVSGINEQSALGLMAYGHRREADCTDIEVLVPAAAGTRDAIGAKINKVVPRGKTPIGDAVIQAAEALDYREVKATVVLVSDGIETCGVDLCKLAETLAADGLEFTSHVIGFDLDEEESAGLECLASGTGGRFFSAADADQLSDALKQTVPDAGETAANGDDGGRLEDIVVRGSDVIFLAGRDDVTIPPRGPEHDPHFLLGRHGHLEEPLMETRPPFVAVQPGDVVRILDLARGGIHFFPQANAPGWGPAGSHGGSEIAALGGISGYKGSRGALLGVFLDDNNPADAEPPAVLDFSDSGLGLHYATLSPELRQVFYIGDGTTDVAGQFKEITAPGGATRLFLGIADAWGFHGPPGYYDDNDGEYTVRVGVDVSPEIGPE